MNRRNVFKKMFDFLMAQGHRSVTRDGSCMYLRKNGDRCAIGALIPDGHPALGRGGYRLNVRKIIEKYPDLNEIFGIRGEKDIRFLEYGQLAHDGACPGEGESEKDAFRVCFSIVKREWSI